MHNLGHRRAPSSHPGDHGGARRLPNLRHVCRDSGRQSLVVGRGLRATRRATSVPVHREQYCRPVASLGAYRSLSRAVTNAEEAHAHGEHRRPVGEQHEGRQQHGPQATLSQDQVIQNETIQ